MTPAAAIEGRPQQPLLNYGSSPAIRLPVRSARRSFGSILMHPSSTGSFLLSRRTKTASRDGCTRGLRPRRWPAGRCQRQHCSQRRRWRVRWMCHVEQRRPHLWGRQFSLPAGRQARNRFPLALGQHRAHRPQDQFNRPAWARPWTARRRCPNPTQAKPGLGAKLTAVALGLSGGMPGIEKGIEYYQGVKTSPSPISSASRSSSKSRRSQRKRWLRASSARSEVPLHEADARKADAFSKTEAYRGRRRGGQSAAGAPERTDRRGHGYQRQHHYLAENVGEARQRSRLASASSYSMSIRPCPSDAMSRQGRAGFGIHL